MTLPWFRLYTEFATDPQIQMLAFEDQRHYVMTLCLKGMGLLDKTYPSPDFRARLIAATLGLDGPACDEANRRLRENGLVDKDWQPLNWEKRQFRSDHNAKERQRLVRQRKNAGVTTKRCDSHSLEAEADTDTDSDREEAAALEIPEAPKDFDSEKEHPAFVAWCRKRGLAPNTERWRGWVLKAVDSGRYAKRPKRPPTEAECLAERRRIIAAQEAS